ncbi:MAG: flagellar basal body rod protein FlgC [Candidatus Margulisbacteria bacterium]|nr:flagellar basal body rod protein FlgC [Candidatus Margulisiibacteriota bacterium]
MIIPRLLLLLCVASLGVFSPNLMALGVDDAMEFSASGIMVQKMRLTITAENIANISTFKTDSGLPYRRKFAVIVPDKKGVRLSEIRESSQPFGKAYDPPNPLSDKSGFVHVPNVSLGEEMVTLAYTQLLHEANVTAFKSAKAMYQQSLELLK